VQAAKHNIMLVRNGRCVPAGLRRRWSLLLAIAIPLMLYYQLFARYDTRPGSDRPRLHYPGFHVNNTPSQSHNYTINLVIASRRRDDTSWTQQLTDVLPNLKVIRYISDYVPHQPLPEYHPPTPKKGREATVYHTYMHDFYHELPDISIFVHGEEQPWHIDGVLQQSLPFALTHLDLSRLAARGGYANLRVSWFESCPAWIDTSVSEKDATHKEEPFVGPMFEANFVDEVVPPGFAGPCCAQFAVTKEAIQRNPRSQYLSSRRWLLRTQLRNSMAGRTWEYMWPWLFLHNAPKEFRDHAAVNCPAEWNTYCSMYGICFTDTTSGADDISAGSEYNEKWIEKETLRRDHLEEWWNRLLHPFKAAYAAKRIRAMEQELDKALTVALANGRSQELRDRAFAGLFSGGV
jgi:hypothetical protein